MTLLQAAAAAVHQVTRHWLIFSTTTRRYAFSGYLLILTCNRLTLWIRLAQFGRKSATVTDAPLCDDLSRSAGVVHFKIWYDENLPFMASTMRAKVRKPALTEPEGKRDGHMHAHACTLARLPGVHTACSNGFTGSTRHDLSWFACAPGLHP